MNKGTTTPSETSSFIDQETGIRIHRLTNYLCHSNHFYFTHQSTYGNNMLFYSDRQNAYNLYSINLNSGRILQITGYKQGEEGAKTLGACLNPVKCEAYYLAGRCLYAVDLGDLSERVLWEHPHGVVCGPPNCNSDGRFIYVSIAPDLSGKLPYDVVRGYPGYREFWAAHPRCSIIRISVDTGKAETVWEEDNWIGHINTSPTQPKIVTFCHEGPWTKVDQRIWGLDTETGSVWPVRPQIDGSIIGHEYWFADGLRVAYQGRTSKETGEKRFWGFADCDGSEHCDFSVHRRSTHFHSLNEELLVSDGYDGDPYVMLWRKNGDRYEGALLCNHRCSFRTQRLHVHPTFTPDGRGVIFTSDMHGYGNIYYAKIPEFESLPPVSDVEN